MLPDLLWLIGYYEYKIRKKIVRFYESIRYKRMKKYLKLDQLEKL